MAFFTAFYPQLDSKTSLGVPRAPSAWCSFPYHILSAISLDSDSIGGPESPFGLVWLSLSQLLSNSVRSLTVWLPVLTELYNSLTSTQSPTQSLKWHVWSSSSGNNCHAVQRSLSSGTSVYEWTMGIFTLSHFISQIRPRDLFRLLAIGMCHFLPVHHFGMAYLAGLKVKIQHRDGLLYWPNTSLTMAALLPHFGWGCSTVGHWGPQTLSLQAGSHTGMLSPTVSNRPGTWLYYFLTSTCFRCSSAYLHRCISWLTARSRVNI